MDALMMLDAARKQKDEKYKKMMDEQKEKVRETKRKTNEAKKNFKEVVKAANLICSKRKIKPNSRLGNTTGFVSKIWTRNIPPMFCFRSTLLLNCCLC